MSNIKDVLIVADVPFDWLDQMHAGKLRVEDAAVLAQVFLSPSLGLDLQYQSIGYVPNSHGGNTAMYRLTITGQEALQMELLGRIALAIASSSVYVKMHIARARDLEFTANEPWVNLVSDYDLSGEMQ
jgi:hypothetical protein